MVFKSNKRDNKIYVVIAIIIIIIIILITFIYLSSSQLTKAYIEDHILGESWFEDIGEREDGSQLLGLEKWGSYIYKNNNNIYPAYVTVTSFKTIFIINEDDLKDKIFTTIKKASEEGIVIDKATKIIGERVIDNGHKTIYMIYEGNNTSNDLYEKIKIIGETWNCGISGNSIICIGFAQVSNNSVSNNNYWIKIIMDKDGTFGVSNFQGDEGLIFNVRCH